MEEHPIPQDVTGFKFKLIGSMTVKQFLYLLAFGILTTVVFVLQISPFIKFPLMAILAGIGSALAFLPIEGRPMDLMIANFAKTIPSENRYIFKKRGADLASFGVFEIKPVLTAAATVQAAKTEAIRRDPGADKRAALVSRLRNSPFRPDQTETQNLSNIHSMFDSNATIAAPIVNAKPPETQIAEVKSPPASERVEKPIEHQNATVDLTAEKQNDTLKLAGEQASHEMPKDVPAAQAPAEKPNPTLSGGFPVLPDVGNVLMGIIRDPRAKNLPNIIVEALDEAGTPVRAFKTNGLGQFSAATQLPNGKYKIHFEDPGKQHEFADVEINLTGEIFQPLEITSIDAREKLRQELFGAGQATIAPTMPAAA
jgi:hypothetical protein